jgi:hypothetical protein
MNGHLCFSRCLTFCQSVHTSGACQRGILPRLLDLSSTCILGLVAAHPPFRIIARHSGNTPSRTYHQLSCDWLSFEDVFVFVLVR